MYCCPDRITYVVMRYLPVAMRTNHGAMSMSALDRLVIHANITNVELLPLHSYACTPANLMIGYTYGP